MRWTLGSWGLVLGGICHATSPAASPSASAVHAGTDSDHHSLGVECRCDRAPASARVDAAASLPPSEVEGWVAEYSVKRAAFYLNESSRLLDMALEQIRGTDELQDDPYVKIWEATNNVLAALDLAPQDPLTWVEAGLLHLRAIVYNEESESGEAEEAFAMFRTGLHLAATPADRTAAFAPLARIRASRCREKDGKMRARRKLIPKEEHSMYDLLCRRVDKLEHGQASLSLIGKLLSTKFRSGTRGTFAETHESGARPEGNAAGYSAAENGGGDAAVPVRPPSAPVGACAAACGRGSSHESSLRTGRSYLKWAAGGGGEAEAADTPTAMSAAGQGGKAAIAAILDRPENCPTKIFATPFLRVNFRAYLGEAGLATLGRLAEARYTTFASQMAAQGTTEANDVNDQFFSRQFSGDDRDSAAAYEWWPELYRDSAEWRALVEVLEEGALDFAVKVASARTGAGTVDRDSLREATYSVIWAAVYPEGARGGGRHGAHAHQSSITSCVFYVVTGNSTAPIGFFDPRGAPVHKDYERHSTEFEWQPRAPFHQPLWLFPEPGDLVCFPSWLIHAVPRKLDAATTRVAFPINLQVHKLLDSWHMTATAT